MTVEQLQKAQELLLAIEKNAAEQHQAIMDVKKSLDNYSDWLIKEIKRLRDEAVEK